MKVAGYVLFAVTLLAYIWTVRTIWHLVAEANQLEQGRRFSRVFWTPAWKLHKAAFPASRLRHQIIVRFLITWALCIVSMACIGYAEIHAALR